MVSSCCFHSLAVWHVRCGIMDPVTDSLRQIFFSFAGEGVGSAFCATAPDDMANAATPITTNKSCRMTLSS
ncbi:hypothetical protein SPHINGO361_110353 [Sphingomonas sp. EC-HK361]|nr:hypothetical protein SPHINGO361_110353 [Sphingomonas sp. EC-HK361]